MSRLGHKAPNHIRKPRVTVKPDTLIGVLLVCSPSGMTLLLSTWLFGVVQAGMPQRGPDMCSRDMRLVFISEEKAVTVSRSPHRSDERCPPVNHRALAQRQQGMKDDISGPAAAITARKWDSIQCCAYDKAFIVQYLRGQHTLWNSAPNSLQCAATG